MLLYSITVSLSGICRTGSQSGDITLSNKFYPPFFVLNLVFVYWSFSLLYVFDVLQPSHFGLSVLSPKTMTNEKEQVLLGSDRLSLLWLTLGSCRSTLRHVCPKVVLGERFVDQVGSI